MALNKTKLAEGGEVGVASVGNSKFERIKKKIAALSLFKKMTIALVLALILGGMYYAYGYSRTLQIAEHKNMCINNRPLLNEASKNLQFDKRKNLEKSITQIETFTDFKTDPNCLIPLTAFYIYKADENKATEYFDKLQDTYSENKIYPFFVENPNYVEAYKAELTGMKIRNKEMQESVIYY